MRGCARGATVERSETGERTMIAPAGQSTARAGLRSKLAALVVRRQAGPATWGLHAPKTPNKEVGRPTGYANAVLLFALNACGPSSVLKFGSSPEPPQGEQQRCRGGIYMPPATYRGNPSTGKGPGCRPPSPLSSATRLRQSVGAGHARPATLPLPPRILCIVGRQATGPLHNRPAPSNTKITCPL